MWNLVEGFLKICINNVNLISITIQYNIKFVEQRHHSAAGKYRLMIAEALGRRKVKGSRMAAVNQKETF